MNENKKSFPIDWTVTRIDKTSGAPASDEMPARVPGDVFSDLPRAGVIKGPYVGLASDAVSWINDSDWLCRGRARAAGEQVSTNRHDLTHHDPRPASWLGRWLFKRWWRFLSD